MITIPMPNMVATATAISMCWNFKNVGWSEICGASAKLRFEIRLDNGHFNCRAYALKIINSRLVVQLSIVIYVTYNSLIVHTAKRSSHNKGDYHG